ncbi:MAG: cytochrome c peroxidase [Pseudomonadota bacterium]
MKAIRPMLMKSGRWAALVAGVLLTNVANGAISQSDIVRPAGTEAFSADRAALVAKGEALWNDKSLSSKGKLACASCHKDNVKQFKTTFLEPYPHAVKMAQKRADLDSISAEGMVQFCMLVPMKNDTLPWDSEELAALTAYTEDVVQQDFIAKKKK